MGDAAMREDTVTLFLCGDVMLGRGVDQILRRPGDPTLRERDIRDARAYVDLAEARNGPVPRRVDPTWPWGAALRVLDTANPDVRVVNLETSVTRSNDFAPGKAVHYRMSPANIAALSVARPDVSVLANNHVLDFGQRGLTETLDALAAAGRRVAGAGRDERQAWQPAVVTLGDARRVLVWSFATPSSGVPPGWAAGLDSPGVAYLPDLSEGAADQITQRVRRAKQPGDIAVASVHWGSNWGYEIPADQVRFAHALIDAGVDLVHGHSSHHPRPIEVYRGKLILYGCGDLINDYEGISGYHGYRDDLRLLYFASLRPRTGDLAAARIVVMQAKRLRLEHAADRDTHWLRNVLDSVSQGFGVRFAADPDGALRLDQP